MAAVLEPEWTLGDRFRKAREVAGLTREEMAAKLDTTKSSISNWENDITRPRDLLQTLHLWSELTGVPLDWLVNSRKSLFMDPGDITPLALTG